MARLLYRSSAAFVRGVLGSLNAVTPTSVQAVRSSVSDDPDEHDAVNKVLGVLVKQKYIFAEGEGEDATYKISAEGEGLLSRINGGE